MRRSRAAASFAAKSESMPSSFDDSMQLVKSSRISAMSMVQAGAGHGRLAVWSHEVVLSRLGWARSQAALSVGDEPCKAELGGSLHQRIGAGAEKFSVAGEAVMFVKVSAQPGAAHAPVGPCGLAYTHADRIGCAPEIDVMVRDPA